MTENHGYEPTTRLVHGPGHSAKWDFSHHVTPPLSSSTTYRLDSARRAIRLSIGLESPVDIIRELGEARDSVHKKNPSGRRPVAPRAPKN